MGYYLVTPLGFSSENHCLDDYGARTAMSDGEGSMSYVYDSYRRLQSETRQFTGLSGNSYSFTYSYNLSGQLLQANYAVPNFSKNINYRYNAVGALSSIGTNLVGSDPEATTNVIGSLSYRAFGAARQVNYGNDRKLELSYNTELMRLTNQKLTRGNGTDKLLEYSYSYTENGLLSQVGDGVDSNYTRNYSYNGRNQLTQSTGSVTTNYLYDDWGNLSWVNENGSAKWFNYAKLSNSNTPATNRLSKIRVNSNSTVQTSFSWDAAGNMTAANSTTYEWDAANRLKSVNGGTLGSYGYDGNGKRVKKTESGVTTYYVISSVLGSVMEVTSSGVQRAYVMSGSSVVAQLNPNGSFYWLNQDHLGSGRKMTDASGNMGYRAEFDPYGKLLYEWSSPANLNTKKFTGYERDAATNLDYAQARMYSSDWGRFISVDKLGLTGARMTSPKSLNRYSYASGDPINRVDRNGMEDEEVILRLVTTEYLFNGIYRDLGLGGMFIIEEPSPNELPGDGGIGGEPEPPDLPKDEDALSLFNAFNREFGDCAFEINQIAKEKGLKENFQSVFKTIDFRAARGLSDVDLKKLKLSDFGETGNSKDTNLYDAFVKGIQIDRAGRRVVLDAVTIYTGKSPVVITYYQGQGVPKHMVIGHEVVHALFAQNHIALATTLKLGTYRSDQEAKGAIDDYLKKNCKK